VRDWRPGGAPLSRTIAALDRDLVAVVASHWGDWAQVVNRYLAAHAFANWMAYQGRGLLGWVRSIEAALETLSAECETQCQQAGRAVDRELLTASIRSADFFLRHLADRSALAQGWNDDADPRGGQ
jgi:hypothetical protein